MPVNYQLGKIYRIHCNVTNKDYYGSSAEPTLARRLAGHVGSFAKYKRGLGRYCTSFELIANGSYEIILCENYPCDTRDELRAREAYYIQNNECVNKCIPGRTKQEHMKVYYRKNKVKITEYKMEYVKENVEKVHDYQQQYRANNKEQIRKYKSQPYNCEICNCVLTLDGKARHEKSKSHKENVNNIQKKENRTLLLQILLESPTLDFFCENIDKHNFDFSNC